MRGKRRVVGAIITKIAAQVIYDPVPRSCLLTGKLCSANCLCYASANLALEIQARIDFIPINTARAILALGSKIFLAAPVPAVSPET
jgi:hypothetical protein